MAMEMRQELKLSQQLVMTPQLQQAIRLLQLSRMELADLVHEEMLENPILDDEMDLDQERSRERDEVGSEDGTECAVERAVVHRHPTEQGPEVRDAPLPVGRGPRAVEELQLGDGAHRDQTRQPRRERP